MTEMAPTISDEIHVTDAASSLLAEREGRALRWTARAKIALIVIAIVIVIVLVPLAGNVNETIALLPLCLISLSVQLAILRSLRKRPGAGSAGLLGAIADALLLCALPIIWHVVYTTDQEPLAHLSRHNLTSVSFLFIAMNGLALRPLYPALLTAVAVILHVTLAWLAVSDPRLEQFASSYKIFSIGAGAIDLMFLTPFFVGLGGILVTLAVRAARATVREAVAREHSESQLRERELQAVMSAKMEAVGDIVAGVQHEVNSPLGAVKSAADTAQKAIDRIRTALTTGNAAREDRGQRALSTVESSLALISQASQRLSEVMTMIRDFAQLDRAELQRIDVADPLRSALVMTKPSFRDDTEVVLDVTEGALVEADPRRIAEAISTVMRNAAEAFDGPGKLAIRLQSDGEWVRLEIQDGGRGMAPEQVEQLFEIDFSQGDRMHARFGLPLCRSILHGHGGDIEVASEPGRGTTVTIRLALASFQTEAKPTG